MTFEKWAWQRVNTAGRVAETVTQINSINQNNTATSNAHRSNACMWSYVESKFRRLWARLASRNAVIQQINFQLFCVHGYLPLRRFFQEMENEIIASVEPCSHELQYQIQDQRSAGRTQTTRVCTEFKDKSFFERSAEIDGWDWRGFPEEPLSGCVYHICSTAWMLFVFAKTTASQIMVPLIHQLTGQLGSCLLPGRVVFSANLNAVFAFAFSSFHLSWRFVQKYLMHKYVCNMFYYLFLSERDLEHFFAIMAHNRNDDYLYFASKRDLSSAEKPLTQAASSFSDYDHTQQEMDLGRVSAFSQTVFVRTFGRKHTRTHDRQRDKEVRAVCKTRALSVHELFMRRLLCFKLEIGGRSFYKVRPNRTWKARDYLMDATVYCTLYNSMLTLLLVIPAFISISLILLSDFYYTAAYPGCSPELERQFAPPNKPSFPWPITLKGHHLVAILFDGLENWFLYIDSGLCATFVSGLIRLVASDTLLYWRHLDLRIADSLARARRNHRKSQHIHDLLNARTRDQHRRSRAPIGGDPLTLSLLKTSESAEYQCLEQQQEQLYTELCRFGLELNELQYELFDFFQQVALADTVMGPILSMTMVVWLSFSAVFSYCYLTIPNADLPIVVHAIFIGCIIFVSYISQDVLRLYHSCMRTYPHLCSLIALCKTPDTKHRFLKVLEFFNERQLITFTAFGRYPYKPTTFITMIGWAFSCAGICYALFGRELQSVRGGAAHHTKGSSPDNVDPHPSYTIF